MLYALLIALILINLAYLVLLDRNAKRETAARKAETDERSILLNRVQAPEMAVAHTLPPPQAAMLPGLPWDDDEAFNHAQEEYAGDLG